MTVRFRGLRRARRWALSAGNQQKKPPVAALQGSAAPRPVTAWPPRVTRGRPPSGRKGGRAPSLCSTLGKGASGKNHDTNRSRFGIQPGWASPPEPPQAPVCCAPAAGVERLLACRAGPGTTFTRATGIMGGQGSPSMGMLRPDPNFRPTTRSNQQEAKRRRRAHGMPFRHFLVETT